MNSFVAGIGCLAALIPAGASLHMLFRRPENRPYALCLGLCAAGATGFAAACPASYGGGAPESAALHACAFVSLTAVIVSWGVFLSSLTRRRLLRRRHRTAG